MLSWARFFVVCLVVALPSCGFSPMYGDYGDGYAAGVKAQLDQVYIGNIPDRDGQYLRNALIDRFYQSGRPAHPRYVLSVAEIKERRTDLDITKSSDATRAQLRLDTTIGLKDNESGQVVLTRDLRTITSYNKLQSHFANRVSEQATRESALNDLARQIELQMALYFDREKSQ